MTGKPLESFRKFFGAVRAIFWLWGSFLALELSLLAITDPELILVEVSTSHIKNQKCTRTDFPQDKEENLVGLENPGWNCTLLFAGPSRDPYRSPTKTNTF